MKITKITACVIPLLLVSGCALGVAGNEIGTDLMVVSVLMLFVLPFVGAIENTVDRRKHPEKYAEKKKKKEAKLKAYEKARDEKLAIHRKAETIVEVKLIGGGSSKQTRYGLKGAILGGLLFNVPGAIVGSMIPKGSKYNQRFAVKYADGRVKIKEVSPDSQEYKKLIKYVKFDNL